MTKIRAVTAAEPPFPSSPIRHQAKTNQQNKLSKDELLRCGVNCNWTDMTQRNRNAPAGLDGIREGAEPSSLEGIMAQL